MHIRNLHLVATQLCLASLQSRESLYCGRATENLRGCVNRGLKDLIKEAQKEIESQGTVAFSPRTTSLTVVRPRAQKPADERFFEKLEIEVGAVHACTSKLHTVLCMVLRSPHLACSTYLKTQRLSPPKNVQYSIKASTSRLQQRKVNAKLGG